MMFYSLQVFCIVVAFSAAFLVDEPCTNPKVLDDSKIRQSTNKLNTSLTVADYLCDDVPDGWYRFRDAEISTNCVNTYHCTKIPIWINGTLPKVSDGVQTKTFCVNHNIGTTTNHDCCTYKFTSDVKNCGTHLVYYLEKENIQCPMAYCTCPVNLCTHPLTCNGGFPSFSSPKLLGPHSAVTDFACEFTHSVTDSTVAFDVLWKFNNITVHIDTLTPPEHTSLIDHTWWTGHLGEELSCSVRSYFKNETHRLYSPEKNSNGYWGGITLSPSNLTLKEGEETQITITSTLPIVCNNTSQTNCSLGLRLSVDNKQPFPGTDLLFNSCGIISLANNMFNRNTNTISTSVKVTMAMNQIIYPEGHHTIRYEVIPDLGRHKMWDGHVSKELIVTTEDLPHGQCSHFGHGHIDGFNKSEIAVYLQPNSGDYIMYRAEQGDPSNLEIQNRFHYEKEEMATICATAIQYGGAVVTVDMCSRIFTEGAPVVTSTKPESSTMTVFLCDPSSYLIYTNDDVALEIQAHEKNLELNLHLPPSYSREGLGTCSLYEDLKYLPFSVMQPFLLSSSESFFAEGKDRFTGAMYHQSEMYSGCGKHSFSTHRRTGDSVTFKRDRCSPVFPKSSNLYKDWNVHMKAESTYHDPVPWPTKSGITQKAASEKCRQKIIQHAPYMCSHTQDHLFVFKFQVPCIEGVKTEDGFHAVKSSIQGFLWACESRFLQDKEMYVKDSSTGMIHPTSVLSTDLCPDFCSLQGQCSAGQCQCDRHYTGVDCSMTIWAHPQILDIIGSQVCGDSLAECSVPIFITRNIMDGTGLLATVVPYEFTGMKGIKKTSDTHSLVAGFENKYSVSVNLTQMYKDTPINGFQISLLHNGTLSNSINYIVADSTCLNCSASAMSCTIKTNTCYIDKICFLDGDRKPTDYRQGCNPRKHQDHWTAV